MSSDRVDEIRVKVMVVDDTPRNVKLLAEKGLL